MNPAVEDLTTGGSASCARVLGAGVDVWSPDRHLPCACVATDD